MKAMSQWVEQDGGGLLIAGGEAVFGEGADPAEPGGYRNTELERLAPMTFERKDKPEVALIIVLDKSWSMAGAVMELCKAAAQAAIDVMTDEQLVGVVTFNDGMNWDVTLRNVGKNRDAIRKTIAAIEPSGHTLIYPAIEQAYLALKDAHARAKHVVLLSDGRSYPDDYEGLVKKMVDAKMTVSSIAVGPAADVELLTNIAKWGKGRSYVVRGCEGSAADFREGSEERHDAVVRREGHSSPSSSSTAFCEGVDSDGHARAARPHGDGDEGQRDRTARDRGGRSAARVLADRPRPHRRVRVGREGSLGERLAEVEGLRAVLRVGGARDRAAAAGWPSAWTCRPARLRARRDRCRSRSSRAMPHGHYADRLKPSVTVQAG